MLYKITQSPHGILLFAVPVDKSRLFLIKTNSLQEAELLKYMLDPGFLLDPIDAPELYTEAGLHTDQQTPIFLLDWKKLSLQFLPNRAANPDRAKILEDLMSKKLSKVLEGQDTSKVIRDIIFRFQKQQECSECDKLGINDPLLEKWFMGLEVFSK